MQPIHPFFNRNIPDNKAPQTPSSKGEERSMPMPPRMGVPPKTPMRGRAQPQEKPKAPAILPSYGDDLDNPTMEPTHFSFTANNDYLKGIFGDKPVVIEKFAEGSAWQVWTAPAFPSLVIKTPLQKNDPLSRDRRVKMSIDALKRYPHKELMPLLPLAGDMKEALDAADKTLWIVQMRAEPVSLKNKPQFVGQVVETLKAFFEGQNVLYDFKRDNCGLYNGQLVLLDPDFEEINDPDEWKIHANDTLVSWAEDDPAIMATLLNEVNPSLKRAVD